MSVTTRLSSGMATVLAHFLILFLAVHAWEGTESACAISVNLSCSLYEDADCFSRTREINEKHQREGTVSWPGSPVKLKVEPFKAATNSASFTDAHIGLVVSWLSPATSARFVKGYKLKVVSANCDEQLCTCRFFEMTRQESSEEQQSAFVYNLSLPALTNVSDWTVHVQSIPSTPEWPWSSSTAFVNIYNTFLDSTPLAMKAREWATPFLTVVTSLTVKPDVAVTFGLAPTSLGLTAYVVKLWRCSSNSTEYCGLSFGRAALQQPINTATFDTVSPGVYQVSVEADNVRAVCGNYLPCKIRRSRLFAVGAPPKTPQSPTSREVQTTGQRLPVTPAVISIVGISSSGSDVTRTSVATSRRSIEDFVGMLSTTTASGSNFSVSTREVEASPSGRWTIATYLYVAGAVLGSVLLVGSVASCCLAHRGRRKENGHQRDVTDALALYLDACCSCNIIYHRWHLDDLQLVGPEHWVSQQLQTAEWVAFVHTFDTEHQFWKWITGSTSLYENDLVERILARVFDDVRRIPEKCLSVSFLSSTKPVASFWLAGSSVETEWARQPSGIFLKNERVCSTSSELENKDFQSSDQGKDSAITEEQVVLEVQWKQSMEGTKRSPRVYRLMNDFSLLLADIHRLNPSATALKSRCLPTDADHLTTAEGRDLYKSVALLRSNLPAACGNMATGRSRATDAVGSSMTDLERLDSGFDDDCNVSFIPPEELSPDVPELTSLSDMFQSVNARSQWNETPRDHLSECHSLGWRDV